MTKQQKHNKEVEHLRQKTRVFSRVCGYYQPVDQWNDSQQALFGDRKTFKLNKAFAKKYLDKPIPYEVSE